jgi:hypothetical protein
LGDRFSATAPTTLFDLSWYTPAIGVRAYDLDADASRFVFVRETHLPAGSVPREIRIVQNWFEELRRRAPVSGE